MKRDSSERMRRDFTAYIEKSGIFLEVTYDSEYVLHRHVTGNDRIDTEVEWLLLQPIKVMYSDAHDNEYSWMYGENMNHRIVSALERFEGELTTQVTTKARESR